MFRIRTLVLLSSIVSSALVFQNCGSTLTQLNQDQPGSYSTELSGLGVAEILPEASGGTCQKPGFFSTNAIDASELSQNLSLNSRILVTEDKILVVTSCGIFYSHLSDKKFYRISLPASAGELNKYSMSLTDNQIHYSTVKGLFRTDLKTGMTDQLLDSSTLQQLIKKYNLPVSLGSAVGGYEILVLNNSIFYNSAIGPLVSRDNGKTWDIISFVAKGYQIPAYGGVSRSIRFFNNRVFFALHINVGAVNVKSADGVNVIGSSLSNLPQQLGLFVMDLNGSKADLVELKHFGQVPGLQVNEGRLYAATLSVENKFAALLSSADGLKWDEYPLTLNMASALSEKFIITADEYWSVSFTGEINKLVSQFSIAKTEKYSEGRVVEVAQNQSSIFMLRGRDLLESRDDGKSFQIFGQLSSLQCNFPYKNKIAGTNGQSLFMVENAQATLNSKNAGKSWTRILMPANAPFLESIYADGNMVFGGLRPDGLIYSTNDQGLTWNGPVTSLILPVGVGKAFPLPGAGAELYVSYDGINHLPEANAFISSNNGPKGPVVSAMSFGERLILVFHERFVVMENGNILIDRPVSQNGSYIWAKVRYLKNRVYVLGGETLVSDDLGLTFTPAVGTGSSASDIFILGDKVGLADRNGNYSLDDGSGRSFTPMVGCMEAR